MTACIKAMGEKRAKSSKVGYSSFFLFSLWWGGGRSRTILPRGRGRSWGVVFFEQIFSPIPVISSLYSCQKPPPPPKKDMNIPCHSCFVNHDPINLHYHFLRHLLPQNTKALHNKRERIIPRPVLLVKLAIIPKDAKFNRPEPSPSPIV